MDKNILIVAAEKIATMITKIENMRTDTGILGKLDAVLRLNKKEWSHDEKLQMVDYFCDKIKDQSTKDLVWDVYAARIR